MTIVTRIRDACRILCGSHKAVPMGASWFVGSIPQSGLYSWPTGEGNSPNIWINPTANS